jgi:hypothetical protein
MLEKILQLLNEWPNGPHIQNSDVIEYSVSANKDAKEVRELYTFRYKNYRERTGKKNMHAEMLLDNLMYYQAVTCFTLKLKSDAYFIATDNDISKILGVLGGQVQVK